MFYCRPAQIGVNVIIIQVIATESVLFQYISPPRSGWKREFCVDWEHSSTSPAPRMVESSVACFLSYVFVTHLEMFADPVVVRLIL